MKIKIINNMDQKDFEKQVNNYIKKKTIIDIKYNPVQMNNGYKFHYSAMIIYK